MPIMIQLGNFRKPSHLSWISNIVSENIFRSSKALIFCCSDAYGCIKTQSFHGNRVGCGKNLFFLGKSTLAETVAYLSRYRGFCNDGNGKDSKIGSMNDKGVKQAQAALLDYLHGTRGLQFTDAEHMSRNSPIFLGMVLKKVQNEEDVERAVRRYFRYHPFNEFEPFFESLGLEPSDYGPLLPRNLIFLSDDKVLLQNYYGLCNYGIARGNIGKIYKEATEFFRHDFDVLYLKLRSFERLGLSQSSIIKIVASNPKLLVEEVDGDFIKVLEKLESIGVPRDWIWESLSEKNTYDWGNMLMLLQLLADLGFNNQDLGALIRKNPSIVVDGSGKTMLWLVGFLMKMGGRQNEILSLFTDFPCIQMEDFVRNVEQGLQFLVGIEMDPEGIQKLMRSHTLIFGTCKLKKPSSIRSNLNVGKKRLARIIKDDPHNLKKYALGLKVNRLPKVVADETPLKEKTKFLLSLGFVKDSNEMQKALKAFRGKGDEIQSRYDFLVKIGLDANDVSSMVRFAPQILNQKPDSVQRKIDFLLNILGYPLNSVVTFPTYMSYALGRIKLRFLMYNWLKERGKAKPGFALSSILACSDKIFIKKFINSHPEGPKVWEHFKKALSLS